MLDEIRNRVAASLEAERKGFRFSGSGGGSQAGGAYGFGGLVPLLPGAGGFDYRREVGNLWENSIVLACLNWITRAWTEAAICVQTPDSSSNGKKATAERKALLKPQHRHSKAALRDGYEIVDNHPFTTLVENPNEDYDDSVLWAGTIISLYCNGNSYWYKVRSTAGKVIGLQYIPHYQIEPQWPKDGSVFISYYQYTIDNIKIALPKEDIVHLRYGIDPLNRRKGMSPLAGVLREVCTDNEAATFAAALLRNMGIPGVVISPKSFKAANGDEIGEMSDEQQRAFKRMWREKFGGDNRGEPFVQSIPVDVTIPGFKPSEMMVDKVRQIPEERITAAIGLPAVVAGLGAGLAASSDKHNIETAQEMAWKNCLIPTHSIIAKQLTRQLLPDILHSKANQIVAWDYSGVAALQVDRDALHKTTRDDWTSGLVKRSESREIIGHDVDEALDDIYFTDISQPAVTPSGTEDNQ